jgi:HEAT repeat protein
MCFAVNSFAQSGLDSLAQKINSGTVEEKREAPFQIRNLRAEEASRIALPALRDSSDIVRATAASSVIFLPKTEAATALIPLLSDKSDFVRRETAFALGEVGSDQATETLIQALQKDKVFEVRTAAAAALGKIGDARAVEPLLKILQKKPNDSDEFLRRCAARSVGQIAQIIDTSRTRVMTPQNFLPDQYKRLDGTQYDALTAQFPIFRSAVEVLGKVLQINGESDDTRREAAYSLGAIGGESSLKLLTSYQNSPDPYLAEVSKEAVRKIEADMASAQTKTAH